MNKKLIALMGLMTIGANADSFQSQLMAIAAEEARIANIGANKYMMLYGTSNPIPIINRWNQIEKHLALTEGQLIQINTLEIQKQQLLQQVAK